MLNNNHSNSNSSSNYREILDSGIVHYDATGVRRDAMRRSAVARKEAPVGPANGTANGATKNGSGHHDSGAKATPNGNGEMKPVAAIASERTTAHNRILPNLDNRPANWVSAWKERVQSALGLGSIAPAKPNSNDIPAITPSESANAITNSPSMSDVAGSEPSVAPVDHSSGTNQAISREKLHHFLVSFVMEQTGYPEDIVSVDADLEADLGIDSIKIAQMIGEVIEHFGLDAKALGRTSADNYKNLGAIIDTLASLGTQVTETHGADTQSKQPSQGEVASVHANQMVDAPSISASPTAVEEPRSDGLAASQERRQVMTKFLVDFVIEQTGYPEDIVSIDSDLEADLGIDSIKIAQMVGELNDYFRLDVAALRTKSAADFKTIATIVDAVLSVEAPQSIPNVPATVGSQMLASTAQGSKSSGSVPTASTIATPAVSLPAAHTPTNSMSQANSTTASLPSQAKRLSSEQLQSFLTAFVVEQTGYPEDIVTLDADLEADLGIDSIKIAQMMGEMNDHFGLTIKDYDGRTMDDFKSLGAIIQHLTK